jgi:hypothetical protein
MNKSKLVWGALPALAMMLLYCCGSNSSTNTTTPSTAKDDPSFAGDIQPIFTANCVSSGCHGGTASAELTLLQGQSYVNVVNVASTEDASKKRILPNDATNSYLVMKIEGRQTSGARMPFGGSPLNNTDIQNIKNWVNKGAKNN